ncbi:hypothetical protein ACJRO7_029582 [Eucalyptus globulus]|uniref:Bifunctional inhibitor/plant lipid transfer protein/seed storage helical domain-containing protein n=1 Tax=Eucalyptus globulus TaxID=34317 RepID=A0ABD3JJQ2_EUCGL
MVMIACRADGKPFAICDAPYMGLVACRPAMTPPDPPPPAGVCCDALSHADMKCLGQYKDSPLLPSLRIDLKLALQLLEKCQLPHPAPC